MTRVAYMDPLGTAESKAVTYTAKGKWKDQGKYLPCGVTSKGPTYAAYLAQLPHKYTLCTDAQLDAYYNLFNATWRLTTGNTCGLNGAKQFEPCIGRFPNKLKIEFTEMRITPATAEIGKYLADT